MIARWHIGLCANNLAALHLEKDVSLVALTSKIGLARTGRPHAYRPLGYAGERYASSIK